jgi:hypothetical protein
MKGVGKHYDPELDIQQRIEDMREEWAGKERLRREREAGGEAVGPEEEVEDEEWTEGVNDYFKKTTDERLVTGGGGREKGKATASVAASPSRPSEKSASVASASS